jgi:hypothetical protein
MQSLSATPHSPAGEAHAPRSTIRARVADLFALDLRSLALFRICLGLLLIGDLVIRSFDLTAHYTDDGVMPRSEMPEKWPRLLHSLGGSAGFEAMLFVIAGLVALALAAGYRTTLSAFLSWLLLHSLFGRNYLILQGGDAFLRVVLFWAMFLPLGARWSVDAVRASAPKRPPDRVHSVAAAGYILQICFLYWFTAALKSSPVWWRDGTAVYYALSIEQFATPLGKYLLNFPELLRVLTFATLALEVLGPLLLFVPYFAGPIRLGVVVSFVLFHLFGLGLCLELGPFPYVCAVAWLALLPTWFWERGWVLSATRWVQARSATAWPEFVPQPAPASSERPVAVTAPVTMNILAGFFIIYIFLWNVRMLFPEESRPSLPEQVEVVGDLFGVSQFWNMFAPAPLTEDGWYVVEGVLQDGSRVDLFRDGAPIVWEKPELVSALYQTERWRKYMMNLWNEEFESERIHYLQYLRRDWDGRHRDVLRKLKRIKMYFMLKVTPPPGHEPSAPRRVLACELDSAKESITSPKD